MLDTCELGVFERSGRLVGSYLMVRVVRDLWRVLHNRRRWMPRQKWDALVAGDCWAIWSRTCIGTLSPAIGAIRRRAVHWIPEVKRGEYLRIVAEMQAALEVV
jgi:hypothetical protein